MIGISGYQLTNKIYESDNSIVYQGWQQKDNLSVIVKLLKQEYPSPEELIGYKQEYQITSSFSLDNIIKAYCLEKYQNTLAIVFEDFGGKSLDIYLNKYDFSIAKIIELIIKITSGLEAIHAVNIIHKDINPSNIIFNPNTEQIKIIDFGISTILPRENPILKNPDELAGTLAYISPEQTGRMNRFLDRRSDFYSLGVTFYELLTKQLPFKTRDPRELIYSHIALQPIPPQKINSEIPQAVSDIVMKLMAKNAEDRYQSAWGLKADLIACLQQINTNHYLENFVLAKEDFSEQFQISPQLYGREEEIKQLLTSFDRVKLGQKEISLVAGYGGVGKTTLVNEVRKLIVQQRGYFISGKFDRYQRDIPYSGFIAAFENLIEQILSETQTELEIWKQKLLTALGNNAQLIIEIIPKIELIIGSQPAILDLGGNEAQNRFNLVLQKFVSVFASKAHPLVIFLDDLQWLDSASLKLIKLLITNSESEYLLLIGAYRDLEIDLTHPLMLACREIEKTGITLDRIILEPLKISDIEALIADSFHCSRSTVKSLAELLLNKTNGNPFFLNQLLQSLYQQNLISFNYELKSWQWEIEEIKSVAVTDNVVDLMIYKISQLDKNTQNVLKLAACIGNNFSLKILAIVNKKNLSLTAKQLWPPIAEGLILPANNNYKLPLFWDEDTILIEDKDEFSINYNFLHDRVQEALYALIPEAEKKQVHLQVGQLLLQNTEAEALEENIFNIINQLNIGKELITVEAELYQLAKLNLIAGKKAKSSAAYETALKHLQIGIELLTEASWEKEYELTLALYLQAIEAVYLSGNNFDLIETWSDRVLSKAKSWLDCVKIYEIKLFAYNIGLLNLSQAIENGLFILKKLGIDLPAKPSKFKILLELLRTRLALKTKLILTSKQIKDLSELPVMTDAYKIAAMNILTAMSSASYFANPSLYLLGALRMVRLSIKYGNTATSAPAYARYGLILCVLAKEFNAGYQFGKLALNLLEKFKEERYKSRTIFNVNTFIIHWVEDVKKTLPTLLETSQISLEIGDLEDACLSLPVYFIYSYLSGKELKKLAEEIAIYSKKIAKFKHETTYSYLTMNHQVFLNLTNKDKNWSSLTGEIYDEKKMLPIHREAKDKTLIFYLYFYKLILAYLFEEYEKALDYTVYGEQNLDSIRGIFLLPNFYFYNSLLKIALYSLAPQKYKYLLKSVISNQKQMKKWAENAPMNYQHKYNLIAAELYRSQGERAKAANLYESAIELAKKHEYLHEEALAWELAAKFYLQWQKPTIAKTYLTEARYRYLLWGANAKVKQLENNYPQFLAENKIPRSDEDYITTISGKTSSRIKLDTLDLATILETDRALSKENNLAKLLSIIIEFVARNIGAQTGVIIPDLARNNWGKIAKITEDKKIVFIDDNKVEREFAKSVVNYVKRTQETVILKDASAEGQFIKDPYIISGKVKSILCFPLLSQGKFIGIIYLENNLSANVFKKDAIAVLKLIANRGAIAIDNAMLRKKKSYVNEYYKLGGSLKADAPSYVTRAADDELYQNLIEGNYCYILNARQMGKSSLRVKIANKLQSNGYKCALVDISSIPTEQVTRAEWYECFLDELAANFPELDNPDFQTWLNNFSISHPVRGLNYFFEAILLPKVKANIVIFLEEIDSIRNLSFSLNDFFAQIRYFYNCRADRPKFTRISFVFIGATLPTDLIEDPKITPFNIGTRIRLSGFKLEDIQPLIAGFKERYQNPEIVMQEILAWTGGQPFLTQRICNAIAIATTDILPGKEREWVAQLIQTEVIENWQEKDRTGHLKTIQRYILKNEFSPQILLKLYRDILLGKKIVFSVDIREQEELSIIGIVKIENNYLMVFNRIYQSIFNLDWVAKYLEI